MPVWQNQPSTVKIVKSKLPSEKGSLSGVAIYRDSDVSYPFCIDYLGATERALARHMTMGIGPAHPAYLLLIYLHGTYRVWCKYLDEDDQIHLWTQIEQPKWFTPHS